MRRSPFILCALCALGGSSPLSADPAWARYRVVSTPEGKPAPVRRVTLTMLPAPGPGAWSMHLDLDGARSLRAWFVSSWIPMKPDGGLSSADFARLASRGLGLQKTEGTLPPCFIHRYVLQEDGEAPIEYVDAETDCALLPPFQFIDHLLPRSAPDSPIENGFLTTGYLLGHLLSLEATGDAPDPDAAFPPLPERLTLNRGLLISPGCWPIRETDPGRVDPPKDYAYRPLNAEEYDELIDAGANLFSVTDREEPWVRRRAFYRKTLPPPHAFRYPDILYRSTYVGSCMCIDEPAIRFQIDAAAMAGTRRPADVARLLEARTRTYFHDAGHGGAVAHALRSAGVNLGFYEPFERDLIVWETEYASAYYQLSAGPPGLVHEGRYQLAPYVADLSRLFGPGLRLSAEEMFELHIAYLRGAARAFDADWGISIYGQCDPALAPLALKTAYDRGARYLWFWTADHDHHVPHPEKVGWIRELMAHVRSHPRPPRRELRKAAVTAVALPDGYTFSAGALWGNPRMQPRDRNAAGAEHRAVVAAAMWEGLMFVKSGAPFDFIVDRGDTDRHGYREVVRIGLDSRARRP